MTIWQHIRAGLALTAMFLNTALLVGLLYLFALGKIAPVEKVRVATSRLLVHIAELWISINNGIIALFSRPKWQVEGMEGLNPDDWYLVISNHQCWPDILVLQRTFNRRIPFLKFFLKQELIKVPLLGLAWWALDFPFMKRHSREEIEKNPELRGQDVETTRKACEKFQYFPTSIMNFVEGTRFTQAKHDAQGSPYHHLLKPKAGGVAFTLSAMAGTLRNLLDVTIIYPEGAPRSLMAFLGGAVNEVRVIVQHRTIPDWASRGDYEDDPEFRARFQTWIGELWSEKDQRLQQYFG
jgi:1-acyl-sn-glycerol-3-phosphate acyltransferase